MPNSEVERSAQEIAAEVVYWYRRSHSTPNYMSLEHRIASLVTEGRAERDKRVQELQNHFVNAIGLVKGLRDAELGCVVPLEVVESNAPYKYMLVSEIEGAEAQVRELREAIVQRLGGMHKGSPIWSSNPWDKGWCAGITAALDAFDTTLAARAALAKENCVNKHE